MPPPVEVTINDSAAPGSFIYKHLVRISGPQSPSGEDYDLNTASSLGDPSVFEYEVPADTTIDFARCNFFLTGWGRIHPGNFGGIDGNLGPLKNGCLFEIIDSDGISPLLDFNDGVPITSNDQFPKLAGVDTVAFSVGENDWLPIRFTMQNAGKKMRLTAGQRIRWTNRDDISSISRFQFMVQGVIVNAT